MRGDVVKKKIAALGKSQKEMALLLGVSPQSVFKILNSSDIRTGTLEKMCEVLDVPVSYFYEDRVVPSKVVQGSGNQSIVDNHSSLGVLNQTLADSKLLDELAAHRRLTETVIEQNERLITLLEKTINQK
ncbi:MAG: helix-turn-helix transcriptional regulator [Prevotella sp.]|nr:helix-turn-helix transcriptional regulator [Prevotella sp.]